jgi:hypothetical protein
MRLYHRTDHQSALQILADGFRDHSSELGRTGVWLGDEACLEETGIYLQPFGQLRWVLELDIPDDVIAPFEWVEELKGYREFLVPAEVLNRFGPATVVEEDSP